MSTASAQPFPISPASIGQHSLQQFSPIDTASRSTFPILISRSGTHSPTPYTFSYPLLSASYHLLSTSYLSSDTTFARIFHPFSTQLHITFLTPPFSLMLILVNTYPLMPSHSQTNNKERDSIGTTSLRTTRLLYYQHPETVLLWFLPSWILRWNLLSRH